MAKMSQYTPLDEDDKEYFFGEGEGAVVTVGETSASSGKVNRLVKLSDIGGGDGGVPNAGKGIEYDASTNTLSFYYNGSGGFTTENDLHNHEMMKVKAGVGIEVDNKGVSIDTQHANEGDVLTYHKNGSTDEVVWAAPSGGGGGGGNPYTKVSVTPGTSYASGKVSDYGWNLFDQDVNIANNTYSVLSTEIGYDSSKEFPDSKAIDVFKIKLPANTDFPMAVVEFQLKTGENASVNSVEVYVGETKLTQVKDAPYRDDAIVGNSIDYDNEIVHHTEWGNNYWTLGGIWKNNLASAYTGIVNSSFDHIYVKVQVHIFGSCFRVMTSHQGDIPPAS